MDISDSYRKIMVDEINFAVKKMGETNDASEKLYFFSAIFGVIHRIFNLEYDPDLVFMHSILRATYDGLQGRLKAIQQGADKTVLLRDEQFLKLVSLSKQLANKFGKKQEIDNILKEFTILSYSTSGNGYYLMQKGILKI